MLNRRDAGQEVYRKRGKKERRVQDSRDAEQERCWKRYMNGGCRTGGMQERRVRDRRDVEQERCWKGGTQEKRKEGKEGRTK